MSVPLRALVLEDSEEDSSALLSELTRHGYDVTFERVDTAEAMTIALNKRPWDIVFSNYALPRCCGSVALALLKRLQMDVPFIVVSAGLGEDSLAEAMRAGAHDYIVKGKLTRLASAVERELLEAAERRERRRVETVVQRLAYHDELTDLPNRNLFNDRLQQGILFAHRDGRPLALLLLDLDRFKAINDAFGHHCGDRLLQQLGPRLRRCLRESDTVARIGGDEFAVLLPNTDVDGAVLVATTILKALEAPFAFEGAILDVKASIGIALCPDHGEEGETLVQHADAAMYATKQAGGGHAVHKPEEAGRAVRRLALAGQLRAAVESDGLALHYQPRLSLTTDTVKTVEALARWTHPQLGPIPPDQFITLAEQTGLMAQLTQWVLKAAHQQCGEWQDAGLDLAISMNVSARNFQDPQLPEQVERLLQSGRVAPQQLELEMTESVIMTDPTRATQVLTRLHELGVQLSIDEFGTGYSSLNYLNRWPVQTIKICKAFITGRVLDEEDNAILLAIIDLAHSLDLRVVATGLESQDVKERLIALGCDAVQGYCICPPLPAVDLPAWLKDSPWRAKGGSQMSVGDTA